jgi:hypothetical protein
MVGATSIAVTEQRLSEVKSVSYHLNCAFPSITDEEKKNKRKVMFKTVHYRVFQTKYMRS